MYAVPEIPGFNNKVFLQNDLTDTYISRLTD